MASACTGEPEPPAVEPPTCDGRLQPGEEVVDGPWDRDRDGHYDFDDFGCSATYGLARFDCDDDNPDVNASQVEIPCNNIDDDCSLETVDGLDMDGDGSSDCFDCDDNDPSRSPDLEDICWDEIDNDCDGEADDGCGPDYNGVFALVEPILYDCGEGGILLDIEQFSVEWDRIRLRIAPITADPEFVLRNGTVETSGDFLVTVRVQEFCNQQYTLDGTFLDADQFQATFQAVVGQSRCSACDSPVLIDVTGVRVVDDDDKETEK